MMILRIHSLVVVPMAVSGPVINYPEISSSLQYTSLRRVKAENIMRIVEHERDEIDFRCASP